MTRPSLVYGLGALLLGIVGFAVGDFALQWQPVPADLPARVPLAYVSAAILVAAGAGVTWPKTSRIAVLTLGIWYGLWVVLLHVPRVIAQPTDLSMWLGVAEILTLAAAGFAASKTVPVRATQLIVGLCLCVFGASHFVYAAFSAGMIPRWLPAPLFWVYLTGAGHLAAGASFLSGIATRLAATWLAVMFACFVVLLHLPRVFAAPGNRAEWTMLAIATSLTGAALIFRFFAASRPSP